MVPARPTFTGAFACCLVLAACATLDIHTDYDRTVDFSRYRTFAWAPNAGARLEGADFAVDDLLHSHIRNAVEEELRAAGYFPRPAPEADFLIDYNAAVQQMREIHSDYGYGGYGHPAGAYAWSSRREGSHVYTYRRGTLILDFMDATTKKLLWRGFAQAELHRPPNRERRAERIREAVHRMLQRFPPPQRT